MTKGSNYNDGSIDGKFKIIGVISAISPLDYSCNFCNFSPGFGLIKWSGSVTEEGMVCVVLSGKSMMCRSQLGRCVRGITGWRTE
eukprot:scaffold293536_cov69-Attheya_sp.AAC.1